MSCLEVEPFGMLPLAESVASFLSSSCNKPEISKCKNWHQCKAKKLSKCLGMYVGKGYIRVVEETMISSLLAHHKHTTYNLFYV